MTDVKALAVANAQRWAKGRYLPSWQLWTAGS